MYQNVAYASRPEARRSLEVAARVGHAAKGVIYVLIGGLALMAAFGEGGGTTGGNGVVRWIAQQAFGQLLLVGVGIGLGAYGLWRAVCSALNPENKSTWHRVGYAGSAFVHVSLSILAFQLLTGSGNGNGGQKGWAAEMLTWPGGPALVVLVGIAVMAAGVYQLHKAATLRFQDELATEQMSHSAVRWSTRIGRGGLAARGVVFLIMGFFFARAGLNASPGEAKGVGAALSYLSSQPYGTLLFIAIAAGLVLYGAFMFIEARYRRIRV